jgi:hypothetical protein
MLGEICATISRDASHAVKAALTLSEGVFFKYDESAVGMMIPCKKDGCSYCRKTSVLQQQLLKNARFVRYLPGKRQELCKSNRLLQQALMYQI